MWATWGCSPLLTTSPRKAAFPSPRNSIQAKQTTKLSGGVAMHIAKPTNFNFYMCCRNHQISYSQSPHALESELLHTRIRFLNPLDVELQLLLYSEILFRLQLSMIAWTNNKKNMYWNRQKGKSLEARITRSSSFFSSLFFFGSLEGTLVVACSNPPLLLGFGSEAMFDNRMEAVEGGYGLRLDRGEKP